MLFMFSYSEFMCAICCINVCNIGYIYDTRKLQKNRLCIIIGILGKNWPGRHSKNSLLFFLFNADGKVRGNGLTDKGQINRFLSF